MKWGFFYIYLKWYIFEILFEMIYFIYPKIIKTPLRKKARLTLSGP